MSTIIVHWTLRKGNKAIEDFALCDGDETQLRAWHADLYKRAAIDGYEASFGVYPRTLGELPSYEKMLGEFRSRIKTMTAGGTWRG